MPTLTQDARKTRASPPPPSPLLGTFCLGSRRYAPRSSLDLAHVSPLPDDTRMVSFVQVYHLCKCIHSPRSWALHTLAPRAPRGHEGTRHTLGAPRRLAPAVLGHLAQTSPDRRQPRPPPLATPPAPMRRPTIVWLLLQEHHAHVPAPVLRPLAPPPAPRLHLHLESVSRVDEGAPKSEQKAHRQQALGTATLGRSMTQSILSPPTCQHH